MNTICGACCESCGFAGDCRGCEASCGRPFGGDCIAAKYIKAHGSHAYAEFKQVLLGEINALLAAKEIPPADALCELPGAYVNLPYPLPSGETAKFLDDRRVYLGCQIELSGSDTCCGVIADMDFILICRYSANGSQPEIVIYTQRTEENGHGI